MHEESFLVFSPHLVNDVISNTRGVLFVMVTERGLSFPCQTTELTVKILGA